MADIRPDEKNNGAVTFDPGLVAIAQATDIDGACSIIEKRVTDEMEHAGLQAVRPNVRVGSIILYNCDGGEKASLARTPKDEDWPPCLEVWRVKKDYKDALPLYQRMSLLRDMLHSG